MSDKKELFACQMRLHYNESRLYTCNHVLEMSEIPLAMFSVCTPSIDLLHNADNPMRALGSRHHRE